MGPGSRLLFFLLLSIFGLGGCTLLHPHRITNPNLPPGFKEQQRAARKSRKNSLRAADNEAKARRKKAQDPDAADDPGTASGAAPTATAATDDGQTRRAGADKSTVKYDKNGLMKKPKLRHRRYYKPAPPPFGPWQRLRNLFKKKPSRHHGTPKSGKSAPKAPASPTPAPADTGLAP
ncbi:hypothetical protein [uncultured Hymenobacter sp.]|uniref:hypothetical protein n=1 Tax=uncultured Hymenobacter sp. TaxID=170016 RepID=UPI0035CC88B7